MRVLTVRINLTEMYFTFLHCCYMVLPIETISKIDFKLIRKISPSGNGNLENKSCSWMILDEDADELSVRMTMRLANTWMRKVSRSMSLAPPPFLVIPSRTYQNLVSFFRVCIENGGFICSKNYTWNSWFHLELFLGPNLGLFSI